MSDVPGTARVEGFTFTNGAGVLGAGLYLDNSPVTIAGNTISGNVANGEGGGLYARSSDATVTGNTISGNTSDGGGGVLILWSDGATLTGNTIAHNTGEGLYDVFPAHASVTNCILWGNTGDDLQGYVTPTYSCVGTGQTAGTGNISQDPLFADAPGGDYHLKSHRGRWDGSVWVHDTVNSPCLDAGDPASDFGAEPMPNGGRANMGRWGNTNQASMSGNSPPTAPVVDVTPDDPNTGDDLTVVAGGFTDADGDPITYSYRWFRNDRHRPAHDDQTTISSRRTTEGQVWRCDVIPNDGIEDGPIGDDEVAIGNGRTTAAGKPSHGSKNLAAGGGVTGREPGRDRPHPR